LISATAMSRALRARRMLDDHGAAEPVEPGREVVGSMRGG
jgi:hypothetical protein